MSTPTATPSTEAAAPDEREHGSREAGRERAARHGRRAGLYVWAVLFVALVVVVALLAAANVRAVKIDWLFGSTHASLVWVVLAATVLGWLLGITTSILFRFRTRRAVR